MIKNQPPLPLILHDSSFRATPDPNDPTPLEILADMCKALSILPEQVTTKDKDEHYIRYRRLYCYLANVLSSESSGEKAKIVNVQRGTYLFHAKKCASMFESNDRPFMRLWHEYAFKSKLWHMFYPFKQKQNGNCVEN